MSFSRSSVAAVLLAASLSAQAQAPSAQPSRCPAPPETAKTSTATGTSVAIQAANKLLAQLGFKIDYRGTRDIVLANHPQADQMLVVLTMANTLCEMIWSDTTLSGAEKAAMYTKMMVEIRRPAGGPEPILKTGQPPSQKSEVPGLVLAKWPGTRELAQAPEEKGPSPQPGLWLKEPPFYINDSNKYFVIVGSAADEAGAARLMEKLKRKAPEYDFAVYAPYGSNPYYGVMIASWVSRDVAGRALSAARQKVSPDAFLWACRSGGPSC